MRLELARHVLWLALVAAVGCGGASGPAVVGLGEIGTGLWVARQERGQTTFYRCHAEKTYDVVCYLTRVRWDDQHPREIPFEPAPPEAEDAPSPTLGRQPLVPTQTR